MFSRCPKCNREEKYVLIQGDVWIHMCKRNCMKKGEDVNKHTDTKSN